MNSQRNEALFRNIKHKPVLRVHRIVVVVTQTSLNGFSIFYWGGSVPSVITSYIVGNSTWCKVIANGVASIAAILR